jgi:hypothetical protein
LRREIRLPLAHRLVSASHAPHHGHFSAPSSSALAACPRYNRGHLWLMRLLNLEKSLISTLDRTLRALGKRSIYPSRASLFGAGFWRKCERLAVAQWRRRGASSVLNQLNKRCMVSEWELAAQAPPLEKLDSSPRREDRSFSGDQITSLLAGVASSI